MQINPEAGDLAIFIFIHLVSDNILKIGKVFSFLPVWVLDLHFAYLNAWSEQCDKN